MARGAERDEDVLGGQEPYDSVGHAFLASCTHHPDRPFLRLADGTSLSYSDVLIRVAALAQGFAEQQLRRGDAVVCYLENLYESILFDLAAIVYGVVPIPISPVFSTEYMQEVGRRANARGYFTCAGETLKFARLGIVPMCLNDVKAPPPERVARELRTARGLSRDEAYGIVRQLVGATHPNDVCLIQSTSGSTGAPKLVLRKHQAFLRYARFLGGELGPAEGGPHRFLLVAALTHAFGWHMLTTAIALGATVCLTSAIDTSASLAEVRALDPTVIPVVPRVLRSFQLQALADGSIAQRPLFSSAARYLLSAGGRSDAQALSRLREQGIEIVEFYGSSEASIVALTPLGGWRPPYAGRKLPDVELRVDPQGELLIRSAGLMIGYLGDLELTADSFTQDGFYKSGDLAEIDRDGWVRLLGRTKDRFNTPEGSNIYPERLEQVAESLPSVRQAFLVGDGKPFLTLFAVLSPSTLEALGIRPDAPEFPEDGYLDPHLWDQAYVNLGRELEQENRYLERIERFTGMLLFCRPFELSAYGLQSSGKVRRNRPEFARRYEGRIAMVYEQTAGYSSMMLVPPRERRLRTRRNTPPAPTAAETPPVAPDRRAERRTLPPPAGSLASILGAVGRTPLVRLRGVEAREGLDRAGIELLAKLEHFNPCGSVKDRTALQIVQDALDAGLLRNGKTLLDATSGNTGVAYAWLGSVLGFKVTLCVPEVAPEARKRLLAAYGAELLFTDPKVSPNAAQDHARSLVSRDPDRYCYVDQYSNPSNAKAHYLTTGPEIWEGTNGEVTHFVAGVGTTGTLMGVGRRLTKENPSVRVVAVEPLEHPHGLDGLKNLRVARVPRLYRPEQVHQTVYVTTEEGRLWWRELLALDGILAGPSSGAALAGALRIARDLRERGEKGVVVTIFPDRADPYL